MSIFSPKKKTEPKTDPLQALAAKFAKPTVQPTLQNPVVTKPISTTPNFSNPGGSNVALQGLATKLSQSNTAPATPGVYSVPSSVNNPYGLSLNAPKPGITVVGQGQGPVPQQAPTQVQTSTVMAPQPSPFQQTPQYTPFKLDTTNLTSDHLAGDATPSSVMNYRDQLQAQYDAFIAQQQPLQQQYAQAALFSPEEIQARQNLLTLQNGLGQGLEAMRGQGLGTPLSIVRGNQEKLQNQTALQQTAAANTLSNLEAIRLNNLSALSAQLGFNQQNYQNLFGATKEAQAAGIQQGQLGIQQQTANQNRYDYQQITTPEGFPVIQVMDKQTGKSVGTISPHSAEGQSIIQSGGLSQGNGIINGYNITTYATDPNHESKVGNIYNQITSAVGGITSAQQAQSVIKSLSPNSPITGDMVVSAAQKYGVDPNLMIAIMHQDSSLGTAGKATKTFNPGNVGNDDSGNTVNMGSWQGGVEAVAKWLSTHKATPANPSIATLPPIVQQYVTPGPNGSYYINEDKVAKGQLDAVKIQAAGKVPVLSTEEVAKVRSIDVTKQNLASLQELTQKVLKSGLGGRIIGLTTNNLKNYLQLDPTGIGSFNSYRDTAINTIQALAGGSGSGLRLTQGEIETAVGAMPTINDNIETAMNKISKVNGFLDKWTAQILPNAQIGDQSMQVGSNSDPLGLGL